MRSSAFLLLVLVLVALYTTAASATSAARITTTPRDPHGALARAMHARRAMNHAQARAQANLPAVSPHPLPTARNPLDDTLIAQQVHASLGYSQADTYINYVTFDKADVSFVRYGLSPDALDSEVTATQTLFVDEGTAHINRWMHEALLPNLQLGVTYYYQVHVDSRANVSALNVYQYKTIAADLGFERPLRIAMFGDFGLINGQSHDALVQEVQNGTIDMIVHAGDMAYNLDDYNGTRGDQFMQREEPVASALPYMVCPGNHESQQNFSHYRHRFHMPGDESGTNTNLFSSFNVGPVHFVSVSDEMYFYPESYSMDSLKMQYEWLIQDLFAANTPEARAVHPWIIVYAHRPMYCTPDTNDDPSICTTDTQRVRQGTNFNGGEAMYGLEDVLMEFKVDFFFSGHMHSYERLYAVYNNTLLSESYHNMESPLHIVAGAAGCQEDLDHYGTEIPEWSAVRSDSYGYGKLHVYNATHMYWEQILDLNGAVLDSVWVTKDPYPFAAQVVEQATVVA